MESGRTRGCSPLTKGPVSFDVEDTDRVGARSVITSDAPVGAEADLGRIGLGAFSAASRRPARAGRLAESFEACDPAARPVLRT